MQVARRRRSLFVGLFVALCAVLIVLIGGLDRVELRPSEPIPELFSERSDAGTVGSTAWDIGGEHLRFVLFAFVVACLVALAIGAILSPRLRRSLLIVGALVAVLFLVLMWVKPPQEASWEGIELSGVGPLVDTRGQGDRVAIPDAPAPDWAVILAAVGAATAAALIGAVFVLKIFPRLRRGRADGGLLEELAQRTGAAVANIRAGIDLGFFKHLPAIAKITAKVSRTCFTTK